MFYNNYDDHVTIMNNENEEHTLIKILKNLDGKLNS